MPAAAWTTTAATSTRISCCRAASNTRLVEFRDDGQLVMVSIVDYLPDGLSSVYTFFDPDLRERQLRHIQRALADRACRALGLPYLYLGYWIRESRKMAYKSRFAPIEGFIDGEWRPLRDDEIGA